MTMAEVKDALAEDIQRLRQAPDPTPAAIAYQVRMKRFYDVQRFCYRLAAIYPKVRWPQSILHAPGQRPLKPMVLSFQFNGPPKEQATAGVR